MFGEVFCPHQQCGYKRAQGFIFYEMVFAEGEWRNEKELEFWNFSLHQLISACNVHPVCIPHIHISSTPSFRCCLVSSTSSLLPLVLKTHTSMKTALHTHDLTQLFDFRQHMQLSVNTGWLLAYEFANCCLIIGLHLAWSLIGLRKAVLPDVPDSLIKRLWDMCWPCQHHSAATNATEVLRQTSERPDNCW